MKEKKRKVPAIFKNQIMIPLIALVCILIVNVIVVVVVIVYVIVYVYVGAGFQLTFFDQTFYPDRIHLNHLIQKDLHHLRSGSFFQLGSGF